MAPNNGVVDGRLSVWGTEGLKLADLSIPPNNISSNTNIAALLADEKAADFIIMELGLRVVSAHKSPFLSYALLLTLTYAPENRSDSVQY